MWANPRQFNLYVAQREASLVIPVLAALAYLALTLHVVPVGSAFLVRYRESARDIERFLVPVAVGVVLLGVTDILFVAMGPSSWYLPVSTLFVSLVPVALLNRAPGRLAPRAALAVIGLTAALTVGFFVKLRQPTYHASYAKFYLDEAPLLRQKFGAKPPHFVEFDDGIVNYSLDVAAMSNALALDPEAVDALRGGRLYSLAYERGFNCVSTLVYGSAKSLLADRSPKAAESYVKVNLSEDISGFDFDVAYLTESGSMAIVCGHKR
jgi:hypothetical protein